MAKAQILVADGDPGFAAGLAANLESLGYAVPEVVSSPEEALSKAEESQPDLVLLDLGWLQDDKHGKAARQLKKRFPEGLLYLAPDADHQALRRAKITHSFEYLRKSYDSRELETVIDMALYRRNLEEKLARHATARSRKRQERALQEAKHEAEMEQATADLQDEGECHHLLTAAALEAERQKLYQVLDTLPAYVVLLTPDHEVPFANREFIKRFGAPEGRKCYDFLFGRTSPCPDCETYKVLQTNAPHEWEWTGPDGRQYQIYDFPFQDTDGSTLILEMGVDVTLLKEKEFQIRKMAEALRRSYDEMEARVQDRTRELAESNAKLQSEIAERLWSEKKLKESQERYRLLVDLSPDAIAVHREGQYVFVNPAGASLFGADHYRDIVGKAVLDLVHPDYREVVRERMRRAGKEGAQTELREVKILRLDGQAVDVEAAAVGIIFQGQPAVQVMLRDITARKEMERTLERLASFPQLNPNPVLEADLAGNITFANAAALQALERQALANQTRAFLPPDLLREIMTAAAKTGTAVFYREVEINRAVFGMTLHLVKEFDVIRIYARDITGQKRAEWERQQYLEKLQASEEELQVQNEELQSTAEELQVQAEELKEANERLLEAHTALQEREAQLETIFDTLTEGLVVADLEGRLVHWNPAAIEMHGFASLNECQRLLPEFADTFELSTPEDGILPLDRWPLARILRGETLRDWEVHVRRSGADWHRVFNYGGALAFDDRGKSLLAVVTVRDITASKRAEEALRESQKDLNRAQAVAYTGSWRLNVRKNELLWSDENHRIFGIPRETPLTYEAFLATVHPEDRAYVDQEWSAALRGEPYDIEHRIIVDGRVKWVRERAELEFDPEGRLLGGFGTTQDITERKRGEQALLREKNISETTIESLPGIFYLFDSQGRLLKWNKNFERVSGYTAKELSGMSPLDFFLGEDKRLIEQRVKEVFVKGEAAAEADFVSKSGRKTPYYFTGLLSTIDHTECLIGMGMDITDRKDAEKSLQASKDFLEIANRHTRMAPLLQDYAAAVQEHTGCEAVAIRILDEKGDIPYEAYTGFSEEFVAAESRLCVNQDRCLCINVIKGATDPALPCYTSGSSCYINRFSHLLATTPPGLLGETRNACHHFGYESVALIPIVFGEKILGLIHLADHRENMAPLGMVERLEGIARQLGTAINRVRAEEGLRLALDDSRQRQAEIAALLKATRAVLEARTYPEVSRSIYDSCKDLIGASSGYIALLSQDGTENDVLFLDTGGMQCAVDPSLPMPVRGLREKAYRACKTVYDNDFAGSAHAEFLPGGHMRLDNVLFSPLVLKGRAVGLLGLGNKPGGYNENDARLAAGFGELAAMALANKRAEDERERLIQEVETERARLQAIISSAPEAIVVVDEKGRILMTNPAADQLYAHPDGGVEDSPSCALFQFCHADGTACKPGNHPLHRSATRGETHRNLEMVLAWPSGQRRDLLVNTAPIRDREGRSSGAVGLFQDITHLKEGEKELARRTAEFEAIFNSITDGVVFADNNRRLVMVNPAMTAIWGYEPEELYGRDTEFLYARKSDYKKMGHQRYHPGPSQTHEIFQVPYRRKDGSVFIGETLGSQVRDADGKVLGYVGIHRDITERKEAEEKIRKLNLELSDRVREVSERTRQLEAANKELEAFSYSVSHDLRTPLRAIEGFARMLLEDNASQLDQEGLRLLGVIRSNTRIMAELIDDLLALSRLGRQELRVQKIDLGDLAASMFEELRTQAPDRRMELIMDPLPPALGDRLLLNQVVANLLGNAVKFTKPRDRAIIEVGGWTEGKENIYFIKDNGVGFDMRYVDKIFGVFQRLHRREDFEGTGVGLAIVQRIISRHGGRVWATGKVDKGAIFYFALPRKGGEN